MPEEGQPGPGCRGRASRDSAGTQAVVRGGGEADRWDPCRRGVGVGGWPRTRRKGVVAEQMKMRSWKQSSSIREKCHKFLKGRIMEM